MTGNATVNLDGSFSFDDTATAGIKSFTFRANDSALDSNTATVSITVRPKNLFSDGFE